MAGSCDDGMVKRARQNVMKAIKDPMIALRLEYLINSQKLATKEVRTNDNPDMRKMRGGSNTLKTISKVEAAEVITHLHPVDEASMKCLSWDSTTELLAVALQMNRSSHVFSLIVGELKNMSKKRYDAHGHNLLKDVVFVTHRAGKKVWMTIDYSKKGRFTPIAGKASQKNMWVAVQHVSGVQARLLPPLPNCYYIVDNEYDMDAKFKSDTLTGVHEVKTIFAKEKIFLPVLEAEVGASWLQGRPGGAVFSGTGAPSVHLRWHSRGLATRCGCDGSNL